MERPCQHVNESQRNISNLYVLGGSALLMVLWSDPTLSMALLLTTALVQLMSSSHSRVLPPTFTITSFPLSDEISTVQMCWEQFPVVTCVLCRIVFSCVTCIQDYSSPSSSHPHSTSLGKLICSTTLTVRLGWSRDSPVKCRNVIQEERVIITGPALE